MKLGGITDGFIKNFGKKRVKTYRKCAKNGGILRQLENFNPSNYSRPLSTIDINQNNFTYNTNRLLKTDRRAHSNQGSNLDFENECKPAGIFITNLNSAFQRRMKSISIITKFNNKRTFGSENKECFMSPRMMKITKYLDKLMTAKKEDL